LEIIMRRVFLVAIGLAIGLAIAAPAFAHVTIEAQEARVGGSFKAPAAGRSASMSSLAISRSRGSRTASKFAADRAMFRRGEFPVTD
jgi:hypothetical protein